jgi:hypothetical protein
MDLALVRVEMKPDYVFSCLDTASLNVGETVLAIGSPGGLEKTVTRGIVSALYRRFLPLGDVFQIDAAVNHGNSGGPVVDTEGRLTGVVFAGVENFEGLNFAIPAERLIAALPAMLAGGKAARTWLGVSVAEQREGPDTYGEVTYTAPGTPAADQRINSGDLIAELGGRKVTAPSGQVAAALQDVLFPRKPGELIAVTTITPPSGGEESASGGVTKTRVMRLAERPDVPLANIAKNDTKERLAAPLFGIVLQNYIGAAQSPHYVIKKIIRGSAADNTGLASQDPVTIRSLEVDAKQGYAILSLDVRQRLKGYMNVTVQIPALLDSSDLL